MTPVPGASDPKPTFQEWTLGANKIESRDALSRKYSMGFKSETLQHAAFIFDCNLNTNVNIAPNQSKLQFYCKGQIEKEFWI